MPASKMGGVTVVVPTYNRAELLKLTIGSIRAQTVAPLEIIVVDDGSTDHTGVVCAEFGDTVRYLRQTNQGLSAARNTGIRAAGGEWVAFCDSDDLWRPRKLEVQLAVLKVTDASWSVTDFGLIDPRGNAVGDWARSFSHAFAVFQETGMSPEEHFARWLQRREIEVGSGKVVVYIGDAFGMLFEGNVALPSTSIVARKLIEKAGSFDRTFRAEETEFFHRIAAYAPVAIVMRQLTDYRIGHPSLISGDSAPFVQDAIRSLDQATLLRPVLTSKERRAFLEGRRRLRLRLAYARLSSLDRVGARRALYDGWRQDRIFSARFIAIMMVSLLPLAALRGLHWAKRAVRRQLG